MAVFSSVPPGSFPFTGTSLERAWRTRWCSSLAERYFSQVPPGRPRSSSRTISVPRAVRGRHCPSHRNSGPTPQARSGSTRAQARCVSRRSRDGHLGINGPYLGPALRLRRGETVTVQVTNNVPENMTMHWHGLIIPGCSRWRTASSHTPGKWWQTKLAIDQPAATLWFHPHYYPSTAQEVIRGLAGLLIVDDDEVGPVCHCRPAGASMTSRSSFRTAGSPQRPVLRSHEHHRHRERLRRRCRARERRPLPGNPYGTRLDQVANSQRLECPQLQLTRVGQPLALRHRVGRRSASSPVELKQLQINVGERFEVMVDARDGRAFDIVTLPVVQDIMRLPPFDGPLALVTIRPDGADGTAQLPSSLATLPPCRSSFRQSVRSW